MAPSPSLKPLARLRHRLAEQGRGGRFPAVPLAIRYSPFAAVPGGEASHRPGTARAQLLFEGQKDDVL